MIALHAKVKRVNAAKNIRKKGRQTVRDVRNYKSFLI